MNRRLQAHLYLVHDVRIDSLDEQSASLIDNIRTSMTIQMEMFHRILETTPRPSILLAELLEDIGNRYIDFSARAYVEARTKSSFTN